jgi:Spy/CpxP family protein refolding chaperone
MAKSMTKTFLAAGTLALAVAGSARAFGHGMGGGDGCGHGGLLGGGRVLHALDLSADQKQGVRDIMGQHRPTLAQLRANEKTARQAIADKLLGAGSVTQQDLDPLLQQESQARTALMRERFATALEVRKVLTPEQIQKAATIRTGMKQLHDQMHQLLGGRGAD